MNYSLFDDSSTEEVIQLFHNVFTASEGKEAGQVIGDFVTRLIRATSHKDLMGFVAKEKNVIVGAIFFSRFRVPSQQSAFILSPVAIATDQQGLGIGQGLIRYGLAQLKALNVELVVTYGDPKFYTKTGFEHINEAFLAAPYPLSQPIGWLAQSLTVKPLQAMSGPTMCVEALSDPALW